MHLPMINTSIQLLKPIFTIVLFRLYLHRFNKTKETHFKATERKPFEKKLFHRLKNKGLFRKRVFSKNEERNRIKLHERRANYYQNRIDYYTTLSLKAEEIHQIGKEEVRKIRLAMEAIIQEVGFKRSFSEFLDYLRTDPQFYAKSPKELLTRAREIAKRLDEQLPVILRPLPALHMALLLFLMLLPPSIRVDDTFLQNWEVPGTFIIG